MNFNLTSFCIVLVFCQRSVSKIYVGISSNTAYFETTIGKTYPKRVTPLSIDGCPRTIPDVYSAMY